jgi:uncharacterized protein (TIGR02594 family)
MTQETYRRVLAAGVTVVFAALTAPALAKPSEHYYDQRERGAYRVAQGEQYWNTRFEDWTQARRAPRKAARHARNGRDKHRRHAAQRRHHRKAEMAQAQRGENRRQARHVSRPPSARIVRAAGGGMHGTRAQRLAAISSVGAALSNVVAEARRWLGTNPTGMRSLWCARFMNFVLERTGHKGTGSNMARSFASLGRRVAGPQIGAIAVMSRGKSGGHVGVVTGINPDGDPIVISGNYQRRVAEAVYSRARIYAYVMPMS